MKVVGITGLIGCGKSTVTQIFAESGFLSFNADNYVRDLNSKKEIIDEIKKSFPRSVINGVLQKDILKKELFLNYSQKIRILESIYHPYVIKEVKNFLLINQGLLRKQIVLEIPLLFEAELDKLCGYTVLVKCSKENQVARVLSRGNMDLDSLEKVMHKQGDTKDKEKKATFIINNDGSLEKLRLHVTNIVNRIKNE